MNSTRHQIALLAIDIDGTLTDNDRQVSDANAEAIREANAAGVEVVLVSARPPFGTRLVVARCGLEKSTLIAYNGALVLDLATGQALLHRPMRREDAAEILRLARKYSLYVSYFAGDGWWTEQDREELRFEQRGLNYQATILPDLLAAGLPLADKMIVIDLAETGRLASLHNEARAAAPHLNIHYSSEVSVEICDSHASKGLALAFLAGLRGLPPDRVMAIGDNYNDISMLEFAGVGVAVGNAPTEVKAAADLVAPANDEDGVAEAIRSVIL